ncbi:signal peptidase I [Candidatus Roizmanbacteria bacterium RIFCSPHIGHO2_02_FULL_40_13b]|uniref:Signal peptidase I n=1 Tax=Candidatus Roizmanbacteria bacterium RIFCSPHIGHO2_01_FULL_39_24 TaxID=1802032 RepID=A0A1F7GFA4_9BACT|nr:MAG: signal peptidase I [Candidatus Roizmanbacteria bacterium RIFCSPHIGHO2_01_FULL_39_24]OGK28046.1 MAG: signal peptidase I [Candidatus Roizmanbacteria bacterium RIFCSPHIGHO2_02_FULL_40_13b]OGK49555.1 MAG: signal peptidase I [Candidatus Roizmanbacteria bacterium RIFCSPLOWO2_01_FULL_40_32]OGK56416.1 MAG: signal peptidase I [Candidatus Roizmanbacteria bacterium RIFCSPLOWO2_02_FULL_39_8]
MLKRIVDFVMDILETVVFVGSLFIVTYLFIMQPNQVLGASMEHTFQTHDYILTSKISYRLGKPARGDIVVFASLGNNEIDFIKRIVGLPGDRVMIKDSHVFVNGAQLDEPYISEPTDTFERGFSREGIESVVPEDYLFVLGDNRTHSQDSREFGFVPQSNIIGKVIFRYFPANSFGSVTNPFVTRS